MIRALRFPAPAVVLVGASVRAMAHSALRAGLQPYCVDLFCDVDLSAHADCQRIDRTQGFAISLVSELPLLPVIYTGGLENHPDLLEAIAARQPLWGNSAEVVRTVRDPQRLAEAAQLAKVPFPETRSGDVPPPTDGAWVIRPQASCAGAGIRVWDAETAQSSTPGATHVFQQRIVGQSYSGVFVAGAAPGDVRFVGITRQLIGESSCGAEGFQWCGNLGPATLSVDVEHRLRRLANILKWKFGIRGVFGIDFLVDDHGGPWVTEVNPRYPASLELLEHTLGQALLLDHVRCFSEAEFPAPPRFAAHPGEYLGKAVLYSDRAGVLGSPVVKSGQHSTVDFPTIADLPCVGEHLDAGDPVCTVYAAGRTAAATWEMLQAKLQSTRDSLQWVSAAADM